jgi:hypothetical protein
MGDIGTVFFQALVVAATLVTIGTALAGLLSRWLWPALRALIQPRVVWREELEDKLARLEAEFEPVSEPPRGEEPDSDASAQSHEESPTQTEIRALQLHPRGPLGLIDTTGFLDFEDEHFPARIEPRTALWRMRVETERRLKTLLSLIDPTVTIWQNRARVNWLLARGVLSGDLADRLRRVIDVANHASHGEAVEVADAIRIVRIGVPLLNELNRLIDQLGKKIDGA